jgi:hypothetical protein
MMWGRTHDVFFFGLFNYRLVYMNEYTYENFFMKNPSNR